MLECQGCGRAFPQGDMVLRLRANARTGQDERVPYCRCCDPEKPVHDVNARGFCRRCKRPMTPEALKEDRWTNPDKYRERPAPRGTRRAPPPATPGDVREQEERDLS